MGKRVNVYTLVDKNSVILPVSGLLNDFFCPVFLSKGVANAFQSKFENAKIVEFGLDEYIRLVNLCDSEPTMSSDISFRLIPDPKEVGHALHIIQTAGIVESNFHCFLDGVPVFHAELMEIKANCNTLKGVPF